MPSRWIRDDLALLPCSVGGLQLGSTDCLVTSYFLGFTRARKYQNPLNYARTINHEPVPLGLGGSLDAPFLRLPCLCRCSAAARPRSPARVRQGRGAGVVAEPALRSGSSAAATAASPRRPCVHRCACATAPAPASVRARGHTGDAAALASRAGAQEVDLPAAQRRPSADGSRAARTGAAARAREPGVGLSADRGRAAQARLSPLTEHGSASACLGGPRARAAPARGQLAGLSAPPGGESARLRLLHRRDGHPTPPLRALLQSSSRAGASTSPGARRTNQGPGSSNMRATSASPTFSSGRVS